jgi:porin
MPTCSRSTVGGLSRGALLNFMDVSGIEALPSTRFYEV